MKAFGAGIIAAIALSAIAALGLSFVQETVAQAYSTGAARLDQQENVMTRSAFSWFESYQAASASL
jgi:hypothetical protein